MSSAEIRWLSTAEAAKYLGITPRTLYRFIDQGEIPAFRFGRVIRLKQDDVDHFIERQPDPARHARAPLPGARRSRRRVVPAAGRSGHGHFRRRLGAARRPSSAAPSRRRIEHVATHGRSSPASPSASPRSTTSTRGRSSARTASASASPTATATGRVAGADRASTRVAPRRCRRGDEHVALPAARSRTKSAPDRPRARPVPATRRRSRRTRPARSARSSSTPAKVASSPAARRRKPSRARAAAASSARALAAHADRRPARSASRPSKRSGRPPPARRYARTPTMAATEVKIAVPGNHLMVGLLGQRDELLRLVEAAFPDAASSSGATRSPSPARAPMPRRARSRSWSACSQAGAAARRRRHPAAPSTW